MYNNRIKYKNINKLSIFIMMLSFVLLLVGCVSNKDEIIKVGDNEVPSLYSVVGEREITGSEKNVKTELKMVELTYKSGVVSQDDLVAYTEHLIDNGWLLTKEIEESQEGYIWQLGKESKKEGNIILIDVFWPELGSAKIVYREGEGTITSY